MLCLWKKLKYFYYLNRSWKLSWKGFSYDFPSGLAPIYCHVLAWPMWLLSIFKAIFGAWKIKSWPYIPLFLCPSFHSAPLARSPLRDLAPIRSLSHGKLSSLPFRQWGRPRGSLYTTLLSSEQAGWPSRTPVPTNGRPVRAFTAWFLPGGDFPEPRRGLKMTPMPTCSQSRKKSPELFQKNTRQVSCAQPDTWLGWAALKEHVWAVKEPLGNRMLFKTRK